MDMKNRAFKICKYILSLLLIGLSYGIFVRKTGFAIPCIFYRITGFQCPGCGVTRMCLALMRFDFVEAYHYNKLLFIISLFITLGKFQLSNLIKTAIKISICSQSLYSLQQLFLRIVSSRLLHCLSLLITL